jgi:hypothetical protein
MLICTNDGFTGADAWSLPASGSDSIMSDAYDAGTEKNTETGSDIIDACQAAGPISLPDDGNGHTDEGGTVQMHPGIVGGHALTGADHGWTNPVLKITAEKLDTVTYTVTLDNLTGGQPLTPPLVVAHTSAISLFTSGTAASAQLQAIAEGGDPAPFLALLAGSPDVYNTATFGGPILPGARASITFDAPVGASFSLVGMLICTNDAIYGVNSVALTSSGIAAQGSPAYDAGTEANTEAAGDLVPPCGAVGPVAFTGGAGHTAESDVVRMHPGITGAGVLTVAGHGWTNPVARIQVTVGAAAPVATPAPPATGTGLARGSHLPVSLLASMAGALLLFGAATAFAAAGRRA